MHILYFNQYRNGASDKSPLVGTFCGTDILPRFKSFSNHMYLRFKSDTSNEYKGKKIQSPTPHCVDIFIYILRKAVIIEFSFSHSGFKINYNTASSGMYRC